MRTTVAVAGMFAVLLLAGCERQPGPPVPLKSFTLHNVQGLFGGQAIWAAEDRTAFVQVVGPSPAGQSGLWERRYKTKLTAEQWAEVERLVGAHHLLTAKVPERPGVPDEALPIIVVVPRAGATVKVRKWANDKAPDFDPVYSYLLGLCRAEGEPVREGAFEWEWRPDGFEQPW
jgi:hypothetical protein